MIKKIFEKFSLNQDSNPTFSSTIQDDNDDNNLIQINIGPSDETIKRVYLPGFSRFIEFEFEKIMKDIQKILLISQVILYIMKIIN